MALFKCMPAWSMGKSPRDERNTSAAPGPGAYNGSVTERHASPKWSLEKTSRSYQLDETMTAPGPGAYTIPSKVVEGPKVSILGRTKDGNKNNNPGPGSYEPKADFKHSSSHRYTISKRLDNGIGKMNAPGPGQYETTSFQERNKGVTFGGGKRSTMTQMLSQTVPGPGTYGGSNPASRGYKYTFGEKLEQKNYTKTPGPGAYITNQFVGKEGVRHSFKNTPKKPGYIQHINSPGPGAYATDKFSIGSSKINAYLFREDTKLTSNAEQLLENRRNASPGPGAHDPSRAIIEKNSPSWRMGNSNRPGTSSNMSHVPIQYTNNYDKSGKGPTYTMRPRTAAEKKLKVPGPGEYNPSIDVITKRPPSARIITEEKRNVFNEVNRAPGPGAYMGLTKHRNGPEYSFEGKWKQGSKDNVPGPGAYRVQSGVGNLPSYAMLSKSRDYQYA